MKAFPFIIESEKVAEPGMDLRDYFAAQALPIVMKDWYEDCLYPGDDDNADGIAIVAYIMADAMMKARSE